MLILSIVIGIPLIVVVLVQAAPALLVPLVAVAHRVSLAIVPAAPSKVILSRDS
jgi:hypothetical protein